MQGKGAQTSATMEAQQQSQGGLGADGQGSQIAQLLQPTFSSGDCDAFHWKKKNIKYCLNQA